MQLSLVVLMGVTCHLVLRLIISRYQSLVVKSQLKLVQEGNLVWGKFLLKLILENAVTGPVFQTLGVSVHKDTVTL